MSDILELYKQISSLLDHMFTEYILFTINPHERESFLSGVQYIYLVRACEAQHFLVRLCKLVSIMSWSESDTELYGGFVEFLKEFLSSGPALNNIKVQHVILNSVFSVFSIDEVFLCCSYKINHLQLVTIQTLRVFWTNV
jgi:hypothetical protein